MTDFISLKGRRAPEENSPGGGGQKKRSKTAIRAEFGTSSLRKSQISYFFELRMCLQHVFGICDGFGISIRPPQGAPLPRKRAPRPRREHIKPKRRPRKREKLRSEENSGRQASVKSKICMHKNASMCLQHLLRN